jgi:hypothetical protein
MKDCFFVVVTVVLVAPEVDMVVLVLSISKNIVSINGGFDLNEGFLLILINFAGFIICICSREEEKEKSPIQENQESKVTQHSTKEFFSRLLIQHNGSGGGGGGTGRLSL